MLKCPKNKGNNVVFGKDVKNKLLNTSLSPGPGNYNKLS